jgi:cytidylate kinase
MKREMSRSLDQIVKEQIAKWNQQQIEHKKKSGAPLRPCITISRDPGSGGTKVARRLAEKLNMDVVGKKIIQQIAERADISEKVIATLDEKEVRLRDSWLESLFHTRHIWPDEYLQYLTKVVCTIGRHGNTIIIGRGGQFLLPPEETFRVRLFAAREIRIENVMRDSETDYESAKRYVFTTEADRNAFHCKHFGANWKDSAYYDLIVNTGSLGSEGAVSVIQSAFAEWEKHRQAPGAGQ